MISLSQEELNDFRDKMKDFSTSLEGEQKELFDAIFAIAWQVAAEQPDLERGFDGCFTPHQAGLLVQYAGAADYVPGISAAMIKGSAQMIRWTANP